MASIIIDEIVPTKWRLRLRDPEGKTREVEVRAGTPVQLDTDELKGAGTGKKSEHSNEESSPREGREKSRGDAADNARTADKPRVDAADKSRRADKPRAESDTTRGTDKPRIDAADKSRTSERPRAGSDKARVTDKPRAADKARTGGRAPNTARAGNTAKPVEDRPEPTPEPPAIRRRKPEPGPGPGGLVWEPIEDDGIPGVRASFERGAFKILHAGGEAYGLFYEWNSGKYQTLQCGPLDALKQAAARWTEDGKLQAPRSNLGAEAAKLACAPKDEPAAPGAEAVKDNPPASKNNPPTPPSNGGVPPVDPEKDKILMQGFEASVQKMMVARKGAT
jgi:hypothetical protein